MREPIKVLADILKAELDLVDGQIMLAYEQFDIPTTEGLYVALSHISGKPISSNSYFDADTNKEIRQTVVRHLMQIDIMSFNDEARTRKEEFLMALSSFASQAMQEANGMSLAWSPQGFANTSSLEETKFLNRFSITVSITAIFTKIKDTPYFDSFNAEFIENDATKFIPAGPAEVQ